MILEKIKWLFTSIDNNEGRINNHTILRSDIKQEE